MIGGGDLSRQPSSSQALRAAVMELAARAGIHAHVHPHVMRGEWWATAEFRHPDAVAADAGGIDISFNLITHPHTHGIPLAEMAVDDFMARVETAARTTFLTARAAARHMIPRRSGVILAFGGPGDRSGPMRDYYLGGTQVAFDAIETIRRQLAVELGLHGVRVVTLASGGVPESLPEGFERREKIVEMIEAQTLFGRAATLEDVGNAAAFAASEWARGMTATIVNVSCGALID